jgi:NADH-quinone oxidoreductase subunit C
MNMIANQTIIDDLTKQFGEAILHTEEPYNFLTITTKREKIIDILRYLFNHTTFKFQFLTDICGIHYPDNKGQELGVIYHLHSLTTNTRLRLKIFFPIEDPHVPTATVLYESANWMERETYDFYGVIFTGHPNLIRVLNMEDMDYFPLRKEYPLEDPTRRDKHDEYFGR